MVLLDVVNEKLETITTHIIRPVTERDVVEFVVLVVSHASHGGEAPLSWLLGDDR